MSVCMAFFSHFLYEIFIYNSCDIYKTSLNMQLINLKLELRKNVWDYACLPLEALVYIYVCACMYTMFVLILQSILRADVTEEKRSYRD